MKKYFWEGFLAGVFFVTAKAGKFSGNGKKYIWRKRCD